MKIINFGSCNIDYVYSVPHLVRPGETVGATQRSIFPGGKGLNQSIAAARSGGKIYHAGCIGSDGLFLKELLEENGADVSYLKTVSEPTGNAIIQVDSNGENSIILHRGANFTIDREFVDSTLSDFCEGDIIVLQNEISCIDYIVDTAYKKGMKIIFNPSPFNETVAAIDFSKLFTIVLNEVEALEITKEKEPFNVCKFFNKSYPELKVVLTLGADGSMYSDGAGSEPVYCPAFKVKVTDTTSAGDTFTGYWISGLASGMKPEQILKFASAASALAVSEAGAATSIPTREKVETAMAALQQ